MAGWSTSHIAMSTEQGASLVNDQVNPVLAHSAAIRQAAERLGFECLDQEWQGWKVAYRFRCSAGHILLKRPSALMTTVSCMQCRRDDAWQRLCATAEKAGTQCIEQRWLGNQTYHRFSCPCGHQWQRIGSYARRDASCPQCARSVTRRNRLQKDGLSRLQAVAARQGGECLSTAYDGMGQRYSFRCAAGHVWKKIGDKILQGAWCSVCSRAEQTQRKMRRDGLEALQSVVHKRNGLLKDTEYRGLAARYSVVCAAGHAWSTTGNLLMSGAWCRQCHLDEKAQNALVVAQELAKARGGRCLTLNYPGSAAKWHWLCHRGHSWQALLASVKKGHWCRECASMNRLSKPDSKARLRYLKASSGARLG